MVEYTHQKTPLVPYGTVHRDGFEVDLHVKMDTLNPGGSFKDRGSLYFINKAISSGRLSKGDTIVTASAGNHAKGVAKGARDYGLNAVIYMSDETPQIKIDGTKALEAKVELVRGDYHKAARDAEKFSKDSGYLYVPAYEHPDIILGQSTIVTETMIQLFLRGIRPDFFVFPFGGGGLANGGGLASRYFDAQSLFRIRGQGGKIHTYGVQSRNFNTMFRSFHSGKLEEYQNTGETIADGIRVHNASKQMFELTKFYIDDMFDVSEDEIRGAIKRVYNSDMIQEVQQSSPDKLSALGFHLNHLPSLDRLNVIEGAAAAAFACAFSEDKIPYEKLAGKIYPRKKMNGVIIASGNNIERGLLENIIG